MVAGRLSNDESLLKLLESILYRLKLLLEFISQKLVNSLVESFHFYG